MTNEEFKDLGDELESLPGRLPMPVTADSKPTLPTHEERQRIIRAPIAFNVYGGKVWGGSMVSEHDGPWIRRVIGGSTPETEDWEDL